MRCIKYRECNFWCLGNQKLNFRNTKIRLQKNVIKKIIIYRDFRTFWNKCLKCFFSRNLYFNKIVFYSRNLCTMHRLCKYAFAVNEKEIQRDIHFEQSQRRIGEESEDTDANRLYFVVPKKRRSGPPRAPAARLLREGLAVSSQEKIHTNIRPEISYSPGSLVSRRLHECAHVNATRPRGGDISGSVGPGGPTAIVYPRSRERLLIKY